MVKLFHIIINHDQEFDIAINIAAQSKFIMNVLDDVEECKVVPLNNVNSAILAKVIEYYKKHTEATTEFSKAANDAAGSAEELKRCDDEFMKLDYDLLLQILLGANYILFDLSC